MYLFAGKRRQSDIGSFLKRFSDELGFSLQLEEFDIERSHEHDLTKAVLWDQIFARLREGGWCLIVSPPCNTFSRARYQFVKHPGPRPLRSKEYPKGFPWLSQHNAAIVEEANQFVMNPVSACHVCHEHGGHFLLEHPEDLGQVNGEIPGSIWQWSEVQELVPTCSAVTFAVQQCHFGAPTPKPTRFMCDLDVVDERCFLSWPKFTSDGSYLGPLPRSCGHVHKHKLIGKTAAQWNTSPSAAYPPRLCKFIAKLFVSALAAFGGGRTHNNPVFHGDRSGSTATLVEDKDLATRNVDVNAGVVDINVDNMQRMDTIVDVDAEAVDINCDDSNQVDASLHPSMDSHDSNASGDGQMKTPSSNKGDSFDVTICGNSGKPLEVEWDGRTREFTDGFGLCSPTRWPPSARGTKRAAIQQKLAEDTFFILAEAVKSSIPDMRNMAFRLVTGNLKASPFSETAMAEVRRRWAELLRDPKDALVVDSGQPFYLRGMAQWLEVFEDPDVGWLVDKEDSFSSGIYVGVDKPLPRSPQVFPEKVTSRKLDDTEFNPMASNYQSAQMTASELEKKFREEELLGRMVPTKEAVARSTYGDKLRVASMAAIVKPDGGIRPLHDGAHSVMVNHAIKYRDQLQLPGPPEVAAVVRESLESGEAAFCVSADIKSAHRLVRVREADWGYLGCKSDSASDVVWLNKCGTFGISSAPYWWAKLFGLIGRFVGYIMGCRWFIQLSFVDELHGSFVGRNKFLYLWVWLLAFEVIGTPFGYHKFRGGVETEFVGYTLRYDAKSVGISKRRGDWLRTWFSSLVDKRFTVANRNFVEYLGRLNFVAQVLIWLKPHLAPLFAWAAATASGTVLRLPDTVVFTLYFIDWQLENETYLISVERPIFIPEEQFRTDAKCTDTLVVIGGWEISTGRWFACELTERDVPYLFKEGKGSQWSSTPAELLASIAALTAFGWFQPSARRTTMPLALAAGTDNRSNECLSVKLSTTKWPLMLLNMQLSFSLSRSRLQLSLKWRPREENVEADNLTNGKFDDFDQQLRIPLKLRDLDLTVVNKLWSTKKTFDEARAKAKVVRVPDTGRKRKFEKSAW